MRDSSRRAIRLVVAASIVAAAFLALAGRAAAADWIVQVDQADDGHVVADLQTPSVTEQTINLTGVAALPYGVLTWSHAGIDCTNLVSPLNCVEVPNAQYTTQPFIAEQVPSNRIFITAVPDAGYFFQGWTVTNGPADLNPCGDDPVCEIPFEQRAAVTPVFATCPAGQSCLTVVATPAGTGSFDVQTGGVDVPATSCTGSMCTYAATDGDQFTIVPTGNSGAVVTNWNGCTVNGDNSCTATVSGDTTVTATFSDTITVNKRDVNGTSTNIALALFDTHGNYYNDEAGDGCVPLVTTCVYDLVPGTAYTFLRGVGFPSQSSDYHVTLSWSGCTPESEDDYCDFTANGPSTVTANDFSYWNYHVQQGTNGTITSSPAGLDCGPSTNSCDALFPVGSSVVLTSTPAANYTSVGFDNGAVSGTIGSTDCPAQSTTCTVTLDHDPLTIGANVWPNIQVNAVGPGGAIAWVGGSPFAACGTDATPTLCRAFGPGAGAQVSENATPPSTFAGWSGGGCSGTSTTCSPSVAAPATITATFQGNVEFSAIATGSGSVSVSPTPFSCGGGQTCFSSGTAVSVTESSTGGGFFQWSGGPCNGQGVKTCTFTIEQEEDLNASFTTGAQAQVSVIGSGTVQSSPAGIDACTSFCTGNLAVGFSNTFTATPASGWRFSGWTGGTQQAPTKDCGTVGTNPCTLTPFPPSGTYSVILTATFVQLDATPPTITFQGTTPAPNANGWNNSTVTSTWDCADSGSGPQSPVVTQVLSSDGANQAVTGTCTDVAGNSTTDTEGTVSIDETAPSAVTATPSTSPNTNGWFNAPFTVTWGGTDALSGIDSCSGDLGYSGADTASGTLEGSCTDKAGNTGLGTYSFNYDATAPTIALVSRTPANGNGWNNGAVTVTWSCTDTGSGAVSSTVTQTVSTDGANQSATGTCTDNAGNTSQDTVNGIDIDTAAPSVTATPSRSADANGWYNHAVTVTWNGTDALSGGVTCDAPQTYSGPDTGSDTLTAGCTDAAGNSASASFTFKYDSTAPAIALTSTAPQGWHNAPVTVTWSCTDTGSGPTSATVSHTLSSDGSGQSSTGTCTDQAGNTASDTQTGIDIDQTAPAVTPVPSTSADGNGWRASAFTVAWHGTDAGSGIASCTSDTSVTADTAAGSIQGTCTDVAGNSTTATFTYKLDTTAPTISASDISSQGTNADGLLVSSYPGISASDNLGTPAVSCTPAAPHTFAASLPGQSTAVSCAATDDAGNQATTTFQVHVDGTPDLTVAATHSGSLLRGDAADNLTVTAQNSGLFATSGTVTVVDTLPSGLTASAISGTGWTCDLATTTCTRSDALAPGSSYPAITLTVAVASSAADNVTNSATVSGGAEPGAVTSNDTSNDAIALTTPAAPPASTPPTTVTVTAVPGTVTYTVQPDAPGSVSLPDTATVAWPAGALPANTTVAVAPAAATSGTSILGPSATIVSVIATAPDGTQIHTLTTPLEIDFPNAPADFVPQTSEDGKTWRTIPLLASATTLPTGQQDGYTRDRTTVEVFTRHLTFFAIAAAPAKTVTALVVKTSATLASAKRVLSVSLSTSIETHVNLTLRKHGKVVGRWHRWVKAGKSSLKLWAKGVKTQRGGFTLAVQATGSGQAKTSSLAVRVTK